MCMNFSAYQGKRIKIRVAWSQIVPTVLPLRTRALGGVRENPLEKHGDKEVVAKTVMACCYQIRGHYVLPWTGRVHFKAQIVFFLLHVPLVIYFFNDHVCPCTDTK